MLKREFLLIVSLMISLLMASSCSKQKLQIESQGTQQQEDLKSNWGSSPMLGKNLSLAEVCLDDAKQAGIEVAATLDNFLSNPPVLHGDEEAKRGQFEAQVLGSISEKSRLTLQSIESMSVPDKYDPAVTEFVQSLQPLIFNENPDLFNRAIVEFMQSRTFASLSEAQRSRLVFSLQLIAQNRITYAKSILKIEETGEKGKPIFRDEITCMSPGDRMIMVEACRHMIQAQAKTYIKVAIAGLMGPLGWGIGAAYALWEAVHHQSLLEAH